MKLHLEPTESEDFELFTQVKVPQAIPLATVTKVLEKDLVKSQTKLALIYLAGSLLGYVLSLTICAQCSVGFSKFAWRIASVIHEMPDPWCPFICGAIFGIAPFFVTLLFFNRFQHRYLLRHMAWLVVSVPVLVSVSFMVLANQHDFTWDMNWMITAVATPYICEALSGFVLRQNAWRQSPAI